MRGFEEIEATRSARKASPLFLNPAHIQVTMPRAAEPGVSRKRNQGETQMNSNRTSSPESCRRRPPRGGSDQWATSTLRAVRLAIAATLLLAAVPAHAQLA